jgi:hypothetical protein
MKQRLSNIRILLSAVPKKAKAIEKSALPARSSWMFAQQQ